MLPHVATRLGSRFDKLSLAAGISNIGDGVMGAAFPLLVASLSRDPLLVAGATLVGRLPWFLFALISGALVDRMDRRRVMVVTDSIRAVGVGLLAWGVGSGDVGIGIVYVVAFGLGLAETFFDTSAEAFTPRLVERDQLAAANADSRVWNGLAGRSSGHRSGRPCSPLPPHSPSSSTPALSRWQPSSWPSYQVCSDPRDPPAPRSDRTLGWVCAGCGVNVLCERSP
jgi:hypothetical protein